MCVPRKTHIATRGLVVSVLTHKRYVRSGVWRLPGIWVRGMSVRSSHPLAGSSARFLLCSGFASVAGSTSANLISCFTSTYTAAERAAAVCRYCRSGFPGRCGRLETGTRSWTPPCSRISAHGFVVVPHAVRSSSATRTMIQRFIHRLRSSRRDSPQFFPYPNLMPDHPPSRHVLRNPLDALQKNSGRARGVLDDFRRDDLSRVRADGLHVLGNQRRALDEIGVAVEDRAEQMLLSPQQQEVVAEGEDARRCERGADVDGGERLQRVAEGVDARPAKLASRAVGNGVDGD